jgi:asparagine synthase (glutamine-hydrolysing)
MRLAKGFLASAEMPADDRYRSYLQVLDRQTVAALMVRPDSARHPLERRLCICGNEDALNRMFAVDAETQLPDDLLMLTDKMSMAVSLECRVPLLDHQLVELAAAMPAAIKVRGGRLKHVLKAVARRSVAGGHPGPQEAWLRHTDGRLAQAGTGALAAAACLRPTLSQARGLFRQPVVDRLMADHEANRIDGTDALLAMMNLEIWSRVYLDRRDPADVATELRSYLA